MQALPARRKGGRNTGTQALPPLIAKSKMAALWKQQVDALFAREGPFVCGPEDVSRSIWRLGKLAGEDAVSLVRDVMEVLEQKAKARHSGARKKLRTGTRARSAPTGASEPTATTGVRRVRRPRAKRAAATAAALAAQEEPLA
ncbi:unnamed protein product [Symbiodinium sp. CCMP2592]|nr:unnamed protein product [Symbiodinium sp. CCMP2592]